MAVASGEHNSKDYTYDVIYFRGFSFQDVEDFVATKPEPELVLIAFEAGDSPLVVRYDKGVIAVMYKRYDYTNLGVEYLKRKMFLWAEEMRNRYNLWPPECRKENANWSPLEDFIKNW
jgi:hypothetical protein